MAATKKLAPKLDQTLARRQATLEAFAQLVTQVPEAADGDIADLLGSIINADSWEDLSGDEEPMSSKTLLGKRVIVQEISRKTSDHQSLTGFFLICEGWFPDSGEAIRFSCGGEQSVAVLSKLYVLGALPAIIEFRAVETRSGNDAINCVVHDTMSPTIVNG